MIRQWMRRALSVPLALLILFEEWGWEPLQRALARLARWRVFAWLERRIAELGPYPALLLFVAPSALLLPVKLAALALLARGLVWQGLAVTLIAKLIGTALVARIFVLTKPALLRLAWFATFYHRWTGWKDALLTWVRASWAWRWGRWVKNRMRRRWRVWRETYWQ